MTEPLPEHLRFAQDFMAAVGRSDAQGATRLLSPAATYHVEGVHSLAGTFSGVEIVNHLLAMVRRTSGTFDVTKVDDWLAGEFYAACVVQVAFQGDGRRYSGQVVFLFRFDTNSLIDKVTVFFEDPDAISRFFGEKEPVG